MDEIKEDVAGLISDLMVKEGVGSFKLHFDGKTEAGDNYAAEILFLRVIPEDGERTYHLAVKTAKRDKDLHKFMPVDMVYDREIFIYATLFPLYKKLIEESSSDLTFKFVPKAYSTCDIKSKQTIIFEDLRSRGFKLHDRKKPWNLDHSLIAMECYGELHALSMALKLKKPEEFQRFSEIPNVTGEFNKNMDIGAFVKPSMSHVIELLIKNGRDDLAKKYKNILNEIVATMNHEVESEEDKIVIGHGDCWNNNFMFQYKDGDETKPTSICFLDFQLSQPSSPVKDLSYNIYSTCDKISLGHFEGLLKSYHDSFSRCLRKLGIEPDNYFTFNQLKEHWKKYGYFGILTALLVLKICLVDKENAPDFAEISKNSASAKEFTEALNITVTNSEEYDRRILEIFIHFGDNFM